MFFFCCCCPLSPCTPFFIISPHFWAVSTPPPNAGTLRISLACVRLCARNKRRRLFALCYARVCACVSGVGLLRVQVKRGAVADATCVPPLYNFLSVLFGVSVRGYAVEADNKCCCGSAHYDATASVRRALSAPSPLSFSHSARLARLALCIDAQKNNTQIHQ